MLYDVTGYINHNSDNYDIIKNKLDSLAKLCVKEIDFQFDPNVEYHYEADPVYRKECEDLMLEMYGENVVYDSEEL